MKFTLFPKLFKYFTIFLLSFLLKFSANAQLVINEFSAANYDNFLCSNNDYEDWIELYNTSAGPINLAGYYLSDRAASPTKWKIPAGFILPAKSSILIVASGLDNTIGGILHTNFKITQTDTKEAVVLSSPSGVIIDVNEIDIPNQKNDAYARMPDGGQWTITKTPTPGTKNISTTIRYAETPDFDIDAGYYATAQSVTLQTPEANSKIRYTLDGTDPNLASTVYTAPININKTLVLKTRTYSNDPTILPSHIEMNTYFIGPTSKHTMKIVSISGNQVEQLLGGSNGMKPEGTFELFDENGKFIDECTGEFNKHGNDSWAYTQRGIDYITRDQFGNDAEIKDKLFQNSDRKKFQRIILKAAANDNYPALTDGAHLRDAYVHELAQRAGMDIDVRSVEFCVLYVNGKYWGIYDMREKVDDKDYTDYYYGLDGNEIDFIKTWGATWAEYGSTTSWNTLRAYILANDMTDPVKFQYVADRLNLLSLADYFIINIHTVCKDWLNWNTSWWSGMDADGNSQKWRYTLWDMDATFGHYINYTSIPNINANADPCDIEQLQPISDPQEHTKVLSKLFENKKFYSLYINRYADLNNTYLSCAYMTSLLDEMSGKLAPEMPRQIARWGGTLTKWQDNVKFIKDFINERCVEIEDGLVDCYQLEGPYNLTVIVKPDGSPNNVLVNTLVPSQYPFVGKYYGGTDLNFSAQPATGWVFDKWESTTIPLNPNFQTPDILSEIHKPDTLYAYFVQECPIVVDLNPSGNKIIDCNTKSIKLEVKVTLGSNDYAYTWLDENKNIIVDSIKTSINVSKSGWYYAVVKDNVWDCVRTDSFLVLDKIIYPNVDIQASGEITCAKSTVDLNASGSDIGPNYIYQWSGACLAKPADDLTNSACKSGKYILEIKDIATGCISKDSIVVIENIKKPDDEKIVANSTDLPCDGSGVTLSISGNGPVGNYVATWSTISGNIIGSPSANTITATSKSWYNLTITDPSNSCTFVDSIYLKSNTKFLSSIDFNFKNPNCLVAKNGEINVNASGNGMPFSYALNGGNYTPTPNFSGLSSGTYQISIENSDKCSFDTTIVLNVVEDLPKLPELQIKGVSCDIASNGEISIISQLGGFAPYLYSINQSAFADIKSYSNLPKGMLTIAIQDNEGCIANYDVQIPVSEDLPSNFNIDKTEPACADGTNGKIEIKDISGGTAPYLISLNGSAASGNKVYEGLKVGQQNLIITDANGCNYSTDIALNTGTNLSVDLGQDLLVANGTDVEINANIFGNNINLIEWTPLICDGCTSAFVNIISDTVFNVLVTDDGGCIAKDQLVIKVKDKTEMYAPNVFSPNGDGINDKWRIFTEIAQARVKQLSIYDRWGGMVFSTSGFHPSDNESAWNGTVNGKKCGQGVYVFMAEIEIRPGKIIPLKGEILIAQ